MDPIQANNDFFKQIPTKLKFEYNLRFTLEHFFGFRFLETRFRKWDKANQKRIYNSVKHIKKEILHTPEFDSSVDANYIRKNFVRKGIPVIIRNGASNWEAFQKWDFSFFKTNYGDHPVLLANHADLGDGHFGESSETNLREIIEGLDHNSMKYARFNPLLDTYPELQEQLDQDWLDKARNTKIKKHHVLFIGNKGTKTTVHNAGNENIFVQIRGQKRWYLWDQRAYIIQNPDVNRAPAKATPHNPTIDNTGSAFHHLPTYELLLNPGDIILIPSYLWHYVENMTPTIGIGNRWLAPACTIRNNPLFALLEIFNTSPSLFTTLDWRKGFDFNKVLVRNKRGQ